MQHKHQYLLRFTLILFVFFPGAISADANVYDLEPNAAWPLCGRIHENPPNNTWNETDGCPAERFGNPLYNDTHIRSTFGPRPLASMNEQYDFHRGIDISCPIGTALFAIADGEVIHFGPKTGYEDPVIIIRHKRPDRNTYSDGSYHSMYLHVAENCCPTLKVKDAVLESGRVQVKKGDFLGYSGASKSGYEHLHFEIRSAPADDKYSYWQQDCIHPLRVLPYAAPETTTLATVPASSGNSNVVSLELETYRKDINAFYVELIDAEGNVLVQQSATPNAKGYLVHPPSFEIEEWNRQYTHKNSGSVPWSQFQQGGIKKCPFSEKHEGLPYAPNYHMDQADPENPRKGSFNGITVELKPYVYYSGGAEDSLTGDYKEGKWYANVTFFELEQLSEAECIVGRVKGASNDAWEATSQVCKTGNPDWPF